MSFKGNPSYGYGKLFRTNHDNFIGNAIRLLAAYSADLAGKCIGSRLMNPVRSMQRSHHIPINLTYHEVIYSE